MSGTVREAGHKGGVWVVAPSVKRRQTDEQLIGEGKQTLPSGS